jgi:hypothetical protein
MPYLSLAKRERDQWRTLSEAVAHVCSIDRCDENAARQQIQDALADGELRPLRWEDRLPAPRHVGGVAVPFDDPPGAGAHWLSAEIDWGVGTVCVSDYLTEYMPVTRPRVLLIHRLALSEIWPDPRSLISRAPPPIRPLRGGLARAISEPTPNAMAPGPKGGEMKVAELAWRIALHILEEGERRPARGRGRLTQLARLVNDELDKKGHVRQADSIRKAIGPSLREWETKNPLK